MPRKAMIARPDCTGPDQMAVQVEVTLPGHQRTRNVPDQAHPTPVAQQPTPPRIPRITRLLALAIKFQEMVDIGEFRDYADIARLGHVSRARITQIMNLSNLAPEIQEQLLFPVKFLPPERWLREVVAKVEWGAQRRLWRKLISDPTPCDSMRSKK